MGYGYADLSTAVLVEHVLADAIHGQDVMAVPRCWQRMVERTRNLGRPGIVSMAIAVVDAAVWDAKARLLDLCLLDLLGRVRDETPVYGSGGFTNYTVGELESQLSGWVESGITRVKMKVGRDPAADRVRVKAARLAIGSAELFVDANGAHTAREALAQADAFADSDVTWFEEPVSSDDLDGLRFVRDRAPAGMAVAAGEYGYDLPYFRRMIEAGAVDALQADATRCAGITGFLRVGALAEAACLRLSAHTAPSLHAHPCCALPHVEHVEYFHDHARIERLLFDGALAPVDGMLRPDPTRPGLGLELKTVDAERYAL
jgi:L-alanine-DL-glutamate epimerase-like enolase superfamily enzyme